MYIINRMINFNDLPCDIKKIIFQKNRDIVLQKKYKEIFKDEVMDELKEVAIADSETIGKNDWENGDGWIDREKYDLWVTQHDELDQCNIGYNIYWGNTMVVYYFSSKRILQIFKERNDW